MAEWGDIKFWDTSLVTSFENTFNNERGESGAITGVNVPNVATFNAPLLGWDTAKVKSLVGFLSSATSFNGDVSAFDTSSVTSMANAFKKAHKFNGDLSKVSFSRSLALATRIPLNFPHSRLR
jgi:surface protein